ncbi:MAG: thioredoxin-dependent thiol peroxidase [Flavobacteriales bacterium]|jgi:peroxiredoxin Q/BCP|nr:thioredoxin-dependent thiol peroxidase [Flavobacteriales bacterium]MCW8911803.1 thioredoxin-dependent thiol peroxidase [Flavobacteriales bacterium]MCW8936426.1 thioredoxin-dependent thiol peroxidase [Flavobacteriales bacterium]MCW8941146.1 thioredoxin-dependent thiol peroxidase [Flavobacteriales bacterium]MCW8967708.1 thioredoxin-dependent thiol peroxidase [Flavobacteriales bacterium]
MTHLKIGDKAPELNIKDQDGKLHTLANYKGKKIILYFYPKDATPGCTAQACNLRDNHESLKKAGYKIIGVSADSENSHLKFIEKQNLNFPLLADTDKELIKRYGVWGEKKFMGKTYDGIHRTTFIIDGNGTIEDIITKVKTKDHAAQVLSN